MDDIHIIKQEGPRTAILTNRHLDTRQLQELKLEAEKTMGRNVHALHLVHLGNSPCVLCFIGFEQVDELQADPVRAITVFRDFVKDGMGVIDPDLLVLLR